MKFFMLLLAAVVLSTGIALSPRAIVFVSSGANRARITGDTGLLQSSLEISSKAGQLPMMNRGTTALNQNEDLEVEVITATENGFDPSAIARPSGPFILALHNMSGEKELVFRVNRAQGQQVHELRLRAGRRANHQTLDLTPGDYVISEVSHPEWSCALTITR